MAGIGVCGSVFRICHAGTDRQAGLHRYPCRSEVPVFEENGLRLFFLPVFVSRQDHFPLKFLILQDGNLRQ